MKMLLLRDTLGEKSTLGKLYVDRAFECETLEDKVRENGRPVAEWKIKAQTAIPSGTYKVTLAPSPKRGGRIMPLLLAVPGFVGVQIHSGNTHEDTEGCILVGSWREGATIRGSRLAYENLFPKIQRAVNRGEGCEIEIRNPAIPAPKPIEGTDA